VLGTGSVATLLLAAAHPMFAGQQGIYVIDRQNIYLLSIA
jgi:hypothetical protein